MGLQAKLDKVMKVFSFISHLLLSALGRASASAGYGISKLFCCAEFAGMPPQNSITQLDKATVELVDRKIAPHSTTCRFAGVSADLLVGHLKSGSFGAHLHGKNISKRVMIAGVFNWLKGKTPHPGSF